MSTVSNERIREAREQLDKIQSDPELMERIRLEEAYEMDVAMSINQAKKEEKIETAKKMLEKGLEIEMISEITGLTQKEIEELKD